MQIASHPPQCGCITPRNLAQLRSNGHKHLQELKEKCHPLGVFDNMERLAVAANMTELYDLVLRDTPLGAYFSASITSEDLDEMNLEILRNTLYKAYLDDFAKFCAELGGATADVMGSMMEFEACCCWLAELATLVPRCSLRT